MLTPNDLTNDQDHAIEFLIENESALLLADVGTGKTVITLSALDYLYGEDLIKGVLVIAPKRVAENVWIQEMGEWSHLQDYDPSGVAVITGKSPDKRRAI